jgi:eukaryotic-like serine/threonine-protein kinase
MALAPGTKLGRYEIVSQLGAGGMGEVYRGRDTRLDRIVAVKILPAHLSEQPEALERFEREARAISSLNHPNICHLYDVGQQDGIHYLVMEYLEGETLASRLLKGPMPLEHVLRYGAEIAEGLDKAHRSGLVHRDLKPGNIMLTKSGAKLMDFGLAKTNPVPRPPSSGMTATFASAGASHPLTAEGTVIGTFQYMSPEQVEGKEVDTRSDIFSFGAVLYEMAAGKCAFEGKSQISIASAILEKEPTPITATQPLTPPALEHVVQTCLTKDPESRWQSAADIVRELRWTGTSGSNAGLAHLTTRRHKIAERAIWITISAALACAMVWSILQRPHPRLVRAYLPPPQDTSYDFEGQSSGPPALSPDGTRVAFTAHAPKKRNLIWIRSLDSVAAQELQGTEGASFPFWSADGLFIGFFTDSSLKKISATGGPATRLAGAGSARGGSWSQDNVILYAPAYRDTIWKISANGGTPARVTSLDLSKHTTHRWPVFLPDGTHFLYFATHHSGGIREQNGTYWASLDGGSSKFLLATDSAAQYASGYLLYHQQTALMAQKFDAVHGTLSGDPVPVASNVQYDGGMLRTTFTVSTGGVLLYEPGATTDSGGGTDLVWLDRTGKILGGVGERAEYEGMRLSPDGKRLAVAVSVASPNPDIWVLDLVRGSKARLTFDPASHHLPSWSPDGQRVAFISQTGSSYVSSLHARLANGGGQDELLLASEDAATALLWPQWSPDGRYLVYQKESGPTGASVWAVPTSGDHKTFSIIKPESPQATIVNDRLSPDGRWLAYSATDSGRQELYVTAFPSGKGRWQLSQEGAGSPPVWRADGKELYYLGSDGILHAAVVNTKGNEFEVENSRALFAIRFASISCPFDVSPDGQRFLFAVPPEIPSSPMVLVLNWDMELKR